MNILLTNDDGFLAPGLLALKEILKKYGDVYVIAPHYHQSGKSVGITFFKNLVIHQIDERTWSVEGTPADCVIVSSMLLKDKIDLVVSGVNNGYNMSYDAMYSGTCGACYQALMFGQKAVAFSVAKFFVEGHPQIDEEMEKVFKYIIDNNLLSNKYFLNVNMQEPRYEKPLGIKFTKLYPRPSSFYMDVHNIPKHIFKVDHDYKVDTSDATYDIPATDQGYISITPLCLPEGDLEALKVLKEKDIDYAAR